MSLYHFYTEPDEPGILRFVGSVVAQDVKYAQQLAHTVFGDLKLICFEGKTCPTCGQETRGLTVVGKNEGQAVRRTD